MMTILGETGGMKCGLPFVFVVVAGCSGASVSPPSSSSPATDAVSIPVSKPTGSMREITPQPKKTSALGSPGDREFQRGNYQQAILLYRKEVAARPNDGRSWYRLGVSYSELGQWRNALPPLRRATELLPKDGDAAFAFGRALVRADQRDRALQVWQEATGRGAVTPLLVYAHALGTFDQGDKKKALAILKQGREKFPNAPEIEEGFGALALHEGRLEDAVAAWERAAKLLMMARSSTVAADDALVINRGQRALVPLMTVVGVGDDKVTKQHRAALDALESGRDGEAREILETLDRIAVNDPTIKNNLGVVLFRSGERARAEKLWEMAASIDGDELAPLRNLGVAAFMRGDVAQARARLEVARQRAPQDIPTLHALGIVFIKGGRAAEALPLLERSAVLGPRERLDYAVALALVGKESQALEEMKTVGEELPGDQQLLFNLSLLQIELGKGREAIATLERYLDRFPDDTEARVNLGYLVAELGDTPRAERLWREAVSRDGEAILALHNLGVLALRKKDYAAADGFFLEVLEREPNFLASERARGAVALGRGDREEALHRYEAVLRVEPGVLEVRRVVGDLLLSLNRPADAIPHLRLAVGADRGDLDSLFRLMLAHREVGELEEAKRLARRFVELAETDVSRLRQVQMAKALQLS